MIIFQMPIIQMLQLLLTLFLYLRAGVMEILLFLGDPSLFFNFKQTNSYHYILVFVH